MRTDLLQTLDWEVAEQPVFDQAGERIKGFKSLNHDGTGSPFAIVHEGYRPIRNGQLLEHVQLITERTPLVVEGYAVFRGGKRVLAYLRDTRSQEMGGFAAHSYMLIGNSHDRSTAFFTGLVSRVIRCENQFSLLNQQVRIHHTAGAERRISDLLNATEMFYNAQKGIWEELQGMQHIPVKGSDIEQAQLMLLDITRDELQEGRKKKQFAQLAQCMGTETEAFGKNLLGVFNGITRYVSHEMRQTHPTFGNPFGQAYELNNRGLQFCRMMRAARPAPRLMAVNEHW